jgi:hypothetical protein
MRYAVDVANPFVLGLASNFEQALRLMEAALADCPGELWATDLWPDEAPTAPTPHGGLHGSAPWFLGYHALNVLDYDLAAELEPWQPPQPFDDTIRGDRPTACSRSPSCSATSPTAAAGCARRSTCSPRTRLPWSSRSRTVTTP